MQTKGITDRPSADMGIGTIRETLPLQVPPWSAVRLPLAAATLAVVLVVMAAIAARTWMPGFVLVGIALVALAAASAPSWWFGPGGRGRWPPRCDTPPPWRWRPSRRWAWCQRS